MTQRYFTLIGLIVVIIGGATAFRYVRYNNKTQLDNLEARMRYSQDLKVAMQSFTMLEQTIDQGVSYHSYSLRLKDATTAMEIFLQAQPVDQFPPSREMLKNALEDYVLARICWKRKLDNRLDFVDSEEIDKNSNLLPPSDPLYLRLVDRFPKLKADHTKSSIDIDVAIRTAWQMAQSRLKEASTLLPAH